MFGTIEQALEDLRHGKFIVVADDEDRENEGDLIGAAEFITPQGVNFLMQAKGMICVAPLARAREAARVADDGGTRTPTRSARRTR
jgi:3,4-dihydroxy 2-butanone 4-phosphate synthase/GTP cyclohydrolase II